MKKTNIRLIDFSVINSQLSKYFETELRVDPLIVALCKNYEGEYCLVYDDLELLRTDILIGDMKNEEFDDGEVEVTPEFYVPLIETLTGRPKRMYTVPLNAALDAPHTFMEVEDFVKGAEEKKIKSLLKWMNKGKKEKI